VPKRPDVTPPPALHELETKVMDKLWDLDEATVRDVLRAVNADADKELAYTTILTILQRLDTKDVVVRRRDGRSDIYTPRLSRSEYREARVQAEIDTLVQEFGDTALVHFARQMQQLDPQRREQLRRLARRA
jgi:predicted transcriptional regulator